LILQNLLTGSLGNLETFKKYENFYFINHDIQHHFEANFEIDHVIHLASCASPVSYQSNPINTLKSGSIGTINALGIARKHNANFLLASTSEVYGDPKVSPQKEDYWGNVNPVGPRSMYDESKRFAEAATQSYISEYSLNAKIIRIFNTFGPGMKLNDGRVVTNFIVQALKEKDITVNGDGTQTRSFSYIQNTIDGIVLALRHKSPDVFNIGNDEEITVLELAKIIIRLTNSNSKVVHKEKLIDDPMMRKPDLTKSWEILGYEPKVNLESGLIKTI
jgi:nucleoside-diphosphate-sugar epimerase